MHGIFSFQNACHCFQGTPETHPFATKSLLQRILSLGQLLCFIILSKIQLHFNARFSFLLLQHMIRMFDIIDVRGYVKKGTLLLQYTVSVFFIISQTDISL